MIRITKKGFVTVVVLGLIVGWLTAVDLTNPPVQKGLDWQDEEVEALFERACMNCHSHETDWPWYAHIAPVYWYMNRNVEDARRHFNVSVEDWGDADEAAHLLREGEMPPSEYLFLHPAARLSKNEKEKLADGMVEMFGTVDLEERRERKQEDKAAKIEKEARKNAGDPDEATQGAGDDAGGDGAGGDGAGDDGGGDDGGGSDGGGGDEGSDSR